MSQTPLKTSSNSMNDAQLFKTVDYLKRVSLFSEMKEDISALRALAECVSTKKFKAQAVILEEGAPGDEMFVLIQGKASVYKTVPNGEPYKVVILEGQNAIAFGESGLVEGELRSATIRTETDCECLVLRRQDFETFSTAHSKWAIPIYRRIAQGVMARLKKTNQDMLLLYNALVKEIRGA